MGTVYWLILKVTLSHSGLRQPVEEGLFAC